MRETRFKQTEIGLIPEDWEVKRLDAFNLIKTGPFGSMLHAEDYVNEGTPIVTTEHFKTGNLPSKGYSIPQVGKYDLMRLTAYSLEEGDIVFSRVGSIDVNALVSCSQEGWLFSGRVLRVRSVGCGNRKYLHYALSAKSVKDDIISRAVGLTMASINTEILGATNVSLPPLPEQQRIATTLSDIDALISALDKKIEKKKLIKQGAMQQLLTGKKRLPGFKEPWVKMSLESFCAVKRGVRIVKNQLQVSGSFPVFQNTNIPLGFHNMYNVIENTPFVIIGGSAGQVGICHTKYWAADDCAFFECKSTLLKQFLYCVLLYNQKVILQNVRQGTVPRLDRAYLQKMEIKVPVDTREQTTIAAIISDMDKEISDLELKKAKYEQIKYGMMQQLLTGKIRIIDK